MRRLTAVLGNPRVELALLALLLVLVIFGG